MERSNDSQSARDEISNAISRCFSIAMLFLWMPENFQSDSVGAIGKYREKTSFRGEFFFLKKYLSK